MLRRRRFIHRQAGQADIVQQLAGLESVSGFPRQLQGARLRFERQRVPCLEQIDRAEVVVCIGQSGGVVALFGQLLATLIMGQGFGVIALLIKNVAEIVGGVLDAGLILNLFGQFETALVVILRRREIA